MTSAQENRLLTQVGPGTPMGRFLRRYWVPALLAEELPAPDCQPVEVRLMGEDLVAFRDSAGQVGLLDRFCPHRRASLAFGRNEAGGLRCIYHGWKFGVDGACLDMPTEPAGSPFPAKLRAVSYPVREIAGIVWTYMGPPEHQPDFPEFDWTRLPPPQVKIWKIEQECNYLQMIERDVDSAHISVLHRRKGTDEIRATLDRDELPDDLPITAFDRHDTAPAIEVVETPYGFCYAALRPSADGRETTVRIYPFVYPWHPFVPPFPSGYRVTHAFVPRDDERSWHYLIVYDPERPVDAEQYAETRGLRLDGLRRRANRANRYFQDVPGRGAESFSGIEGVIVEDHAIVEAQGIVADRSREHLGGTDRAIVLLRQQLLDGVRRVADGGRPPGIGAGGASVRGVEGQVLHLTGSQDWRSVASAALGVRPGGRGPSAPPE